MTDNFTQEDNEEVIESLLKRIGELEHMLDFYQADRKLLVRRIEDVKKTNLTLELEIIKLRERITNEGNLW